MGVSLDLFNDQDTRVFNLNLFRDQKETILKIKAAKDRGIKRMVVYAPTGSGKTAISAWIAHKMAMQGLKVCFMAYQTILVYQTRNKFIEYGMDDPGVIWANAQAEDIMPDQNVQVASIRTLINRDLDGFDVFIWDECHNRDQFLLDFMKDNPDKLFLGLSATPYSDFLGDYYEELILGPSMQSLIDSGRLSKYKLYAPEAPGDIASIKGKDYSEKACDKAMKPIVQGDIVKHWLELGENNKTMAFCGSIGNSGDLVKSFRAAGITAEHIDCYTPPAERRHIIDQFDRGIIKILSNVGVLTAGFDSDVRTLINASPTKNMKTWVQRIGRALRVAEGKEYAVVLDFTGTYDHLGRPENYVFTELNSGHKNNSRDYGENIEESVEKKKDRTCSKCKLIYPRSLRSCPECGHKPIYSEDIDADYNANLVEVTQEGIRKKAEIKRDKKCPIWRQELFNQLLGEYNERVSQGQKVHNKWPVMKFKEFIGCYPDKNIINSATPIDITPEVRGLLKHSLIKYARRIEKQLSRG